jgi:hypothetical protein
VSGWSASSTVPGEQPQPHVSMLLTIRRLGPGGGVTAVVEHHRLSINDSWLSILGPEAKIDTDDTLATMDAVFAIRQAARTGRRVHPRG